MQKNKQYNRFSDVSGILDPKTCLKKPEYCFIIPYCRGVCKFSNTMRFESLIRVSLLGALFALLPTAPWSGGYGRQRNMEVTPPETLVAAANDVLIETPTGAGGTELVLHVTVPECSVEEYFANGRRFHALHIPGYMNAGRPGEPLLPVKGYYIAVPEGASIDAVVLESDVETRTGVFVPPAPRPAVRREGGYIAREFFLDASLYTSDRFYPAEPVEVGSYGYLRGLRVAQLRILPVRFNPERAEVRIYRRIRVKIELAGGAFPTMRDSEGTPPTARAPFEEIYRNVILNYRPGMTTAGRHHVEAPFEDGGEYLENDPCKVLVDEDGIYEITYQDLLDAGADLRGVDPATVKMFERGVETAVFVSGGGDGRFDPGDAVRFFGRENTSPFSRVNVYWLSWGGHPGLRMADVGCCPGDSFPVPGAFVDTLHVEENRDYRAALPGGIEADHWFWEKLGAPTTGEYPLEIPDAVSGAHDAELTVCMHGFTEETHRTELSFNRYLGAECTWHGIVEYMTSFPVPSRYIAHENNKLSVHCPAENPFDQILFNWVAVVYRRAYAARDDTLRFVDSGPGPNQFEVSGFTGGDIELFRITDPRRVERMIGHTARDAGGAWTLAFEDTLDGGEYIAAAAGGIRKPADIIRDEPSNLRSPAHQADYIVIAHPLFVDAVEELAAYRRGEGLAVFVATTDDVYDEFNYGNLDPGAIRDFVSHAYHCWRPPAPAYLLLVGDASCDYRGYVSSGDDNFVPTHLFVAQSENHVTSCDDWFGCVSGDDLLPDMLVGRITARDESDVAAYVDKVIAYESEADGEPWRKTALLVADDPDEAGDFPAICDGIAEDYFAPAGFDTVKVYYNRYYSACRSMIVDAVDEGCCFCTYVGHGSNDRWSYERMFVTGDIDELNNATRYPVVVTNTCKNGWFDYPMAAARYSLAEEFARLPFRGAVACWSYSGLSFAPHAELITQFLYGGLLFEGNQIFGSAACRAKVLYLAMPYVYWDQALMLILFGDPALETGFEMRPDLLVGDIEFRPRYPGAGNPDTLRAAVFNAGRADAAGAVVRFSHGHPDSAGSTILGEATIDALGAGAQAEALAVWDSVPGIGSHPVYVRVDPAGLITESCEWNNIDFDTLTVRPPCSPGDTIPPTLVLSVDGRTVGTAFGIGDFTSTTPAIEAEIRDMESGVDIGELGVTMNGAAIEDFETEHDGIGSPLVTIRLRPGPLADGVYTVRVRATDCGCAMNATEAAVTFTVESSLILRGVANYPNPCREGTCFRYSLSQPAREVTLRIYAVTGALLKTIQCSPGGRNCNEFGWDGADRNGNPLSSGVYFYRLTASGPRGRDEAHGKFVVVR